MEHIDHFVMQDDAVISNRIIALEQESDIERSLEVNMSIVALIGWHSVCLLAPGGYFFRLLSSCSFCNMLYKAGVHPYLFFRKLNFRTRKEIENEK